MAALRNGVLLLVWVCTSVYFNYLTPEFQLYLGVSLDITMVELVTASAYGLALVPLMGLAPVPPRRLLRLSLIHISEPTRPY